MRKLLRNLMNNNSYSVSPFTLFLLAWASSTSALATLYFQAKDKEKERKIRFNNILQNYENALEQASQVSTYKNENYLPKSEVNMQQIPIEKSKPHERSAMLKFFGYKFFDAVYEENDASLQKMEKRGEEWTRFFKTIEKNSKNATNLQANTNTQNFTHRQQYRQ